MNRIQQAFKIILVIFIGSFLVFGCTKISKDEQANELLAGTWKATSIKDNNNFEYLAGTIVKNSIYFRKDSGNIGFMDLNVNTVLNGNNILNYQLQGDYVLQDDGTRLIFENSQEFLVDVKAKELTLSHLRDAGVLTFKAEK